VTGGVTGEARRAENRERERVFAAVRGAVRNLVEASEAANELDPTRRKALARGLVDVSMMAADLLAEDQRLTEQAARSRGRPLARAQEVIGQNIGQQAAAGLGQTVRAAKESIDFPTYVTSLITGVFQAILSSTTQQLSSMGELLDAVSATGEEFEAAIPDPEVMRWTMSRLPYLQMQEGMLVVPEEIDLYERAAELKSALGASDEEISGIDPFDVSGTLLPLARRKMARDKQGILATTVQMGMQRIVVDEGRLSASMDLRVDTRAATQRETYDQNDFRVNARAGGSFGVGMWSANADASTSVGQVHSDHQQTAQQIAAAAGLRSSVELAFRTEQVPLDRLANEKARVRIGQNARVPVDVSQGGLLAGPTFTQFATSQIPQATAPDLGTAPQRFMPNAPPGQQQVAQPAAARPAAPAPGAAAPAPGAAAPAPGAAAPAPGAGAPAPRPPAPGTAAPAPAAAPAARPAPAPAAAAPAAAPAPAAAAPAPAAAAPAPAAAPAGAPAAPAPAAPAPAAAPTTPPR
jgi:hypothetical protein